MWVSLAWRPRPGPVGRKPLLIGHRGVRGSLPENSLRAFRAALEAGLDGIEFDVQRSKDGVLLVYHDFKLPSGAAVSALEFKTLQALDENIPSLEALFELAKGYPDTLLNLEMKVKGWRSRGLEREVAWLVCASGLAKRVLISSFSPLALAKLRLIAPHLRTALLFAPEQPWWLRSGWAAAPLHVDAIHPHESQLTKGLLARARRRGLIVNTWTVNDSGRVQELLALGVDGIIADDPHELLAAAGVKGQGASTPTAKG